MNERRHPSTDVVANRRRQLRRWIDEKFDGSHTAFIGSTNDGEKQLNQGELSGLLREKSFGEKKARSLEAQAQMPNGYLDSQASPNDTTIHPGQNVLFEPEPNVVPVRNVPPWPFQQVSPQRIANLKKMLGRDATPALRDIDDQLDVIVTKWERRAADKKGQPRSA